MDAFGNGGGMKVELQGKVGAAMAAVERGIDRLVRLTSDPDSAVAMGAVASLIRLGPAALGRLAATLQGRRDGPLRLRAIEIIRFIGRDHPRSVLPVLGAACSAVTHPDDLRAVEAAWTNVCADAERRLAASAPGDGPPAAPGRRKSRPKAGRAADPETTPEAGAAMPPQDPPGGIAESAPAAGRGAGRDLSGSGGARPT